ncbi:MAG: hypothetical protein KF730_03625 [Sphingomonas sp.]|uniref:hypothetical protein n=1 Tax=Sphingomonas sp. TaxID=28214 RepID=UPI0025E3FD74|nr:hypothetical protein [Sphingomonas sp.]MBX3563647.1 hypothetical protein [Sphingomonas sp.]
MTSPDPHRQSFAALLVEQVRAVGLAVRREAILAGAALALILLLSLIMAFKYDEQLFLVPELLQPTWLAAILLPYAVWKSDPIFGRAFLWTLPVRRQRAAAAKILAGAFWLVIALLVTMASLALAALLTGGPIGVTETRYVGEGASIAGAARVPWSTPLWMWLIPFTSALILYIFGSAAIVGLRHPIRWVAGIAVGLAMTLAMAATTGSGGAFDRFLESVHHLILNGSAGLDFMLTGGTDSLSLRLRRLGPGSDILWRELPSMGRWVWATLVWLGLALLALALAIRRHWER